MGVCGGLGEPLGAETEDGDGEDCGSGESESDELRGGLVLLLMEQSVSEVWPDSQ